MSDKKFLSTAGFNMKKLVLIGVLAVILIAVIAFQLAGSSSTTARATANKGKQRNPGNPPANTPATPPTRQPQPNRSNQAAQTSQPENTTRRSWPSYALESVLAHDPFAAPGWTRTSEEIDAAVAAPTTDSEVETVVNTDAILLAELKTQGVSMVMITEGKKVAKVGDKELREGDKIGGFVVKEINRQGVVLRDAE